MCTRTKGRSVLDLDEMLSMNTVAAEEDCKINAQNMGQHRSAGATLDGKP